MASAPRSGAKAGRSKDRPAEPRSASGGHARRRYSRGDSAAPGSTIPFWIVKALGPNKIGIECPRRDCGGKAVVNKKKWYKAQPNFITRSCTYCFKANRIPEEE